MAEACSNRSNKLAKRNLTLQLRVSLKDILQNPLHKTLGHVGSNLMVGKDGWFGIKLGDKVIVSLDGDNAGTNITISIVPTGILGTWERNLDPRNASVELTAPSGRLLGMLASSCGVFSAFTGLGGLNRRAKTVFPCIIAIHFSTTRSHTDFTELDPTRHGITLVKGAACIRKSIPIGTGDR